MKRPLCLAVLAAFVIAADNPAEDVKKELKKLEGTWVVISQVRDGKKTAPEALIRARLVFSADGTLKVYAGERLIQRSRIVIDPANKTFDIVDTVKEVKGKQVKGEAMYGIYEFVKGGRRICYCIGSPDDRPTEFASKPGSGHYLETQARPRD